MASLTKIGILSVLLHLTPFFFLDSEGGLWPESCFDTACDSSGDIIALFLAIFVGDLVLVYEAQKLSVSVDHRATTG